MTPSSNPFVRTLTALSLGLVLVGCGSADTGAANDGAATSAEASPSDTETSAPAQSDQPEAGVAPGAYIDWATYQEDPAAYQDGKVVLFFHAPWCPTCQDSEESISADGVPDGLTVVKVDYDTATDEKGEYGVTVQRTFVQIDTDGAALAKWTGTISGADILAQTV